MQNEQVVVAVRRLDGPVAYMAFLTCGRGSFLPAGASWHPSSPNGESGWWVREPNELNVMREIEACPETPAGVNVAGWRVLKDGEAPTDRTFRDAFFDIGGKIVTDMPTAKVIHRGHLRAQRKSEFAETDGGWMLATRAKDSAKLQEIEDRAQALADAPDDPRIDAATTPEELKALTLDVLAP